MCITALIQGSFIFLLNRFQAHARILKTDSVYEIADELKG